MNRSNLYTEKKKDLIYSDIWNKLSFREKEILYLIAEGYTSNEIASLLSRSIKTITNHRSSIAVKLNLKGYFCLLNFAFRNSEQILQEKLFNKDNYARDELGLK